MKAVNKELHQIFSETLLQTEAERAERTDSSQSTDNNDDEALVSFHKKQQEKCNESS